MRRSRSLIFQWSSTPVVFLQVVSNIPAAYPRLITWNAYSSNEKRNVTSWVDCVPFKQCLRHMWKGRDTVTSRLIWHVNCIHKYSQLLRDIYSFWFSTRSSTCQSSSGFISSTASLLQALTYSCPSSSSIFNWIVGISKLSWSIWSINVWKSSDSPSQKLSSALTRFLVASFVSDVDDDLSWVRSSSSILSRTCWESYFARVSPIIPELSYGISPPWCRSSSPALLQGHIQSCT